MIRIIMIYDQVQAGQGTKDDRMVPLNATKEVIGPAVMMKQYLKEMDAKVIATLIAGTGTYEANSDEVGRKMCAMVKKLNADVVICGPSFNYHDYSAMCAEIADRIQQDTKIPAFAAMADENADVIDHYKDKITIVKTPKKGEGGLNEALKNICRTAKELAENTEK
ncbi:GrdB-related putative oxidoreductase [Mediterraneibacter gnavus]|uniref:GrdB-related putative oxidoreductase n=1 Tax=Mediterraneibacter gnavus TaxID=33038 RepID=UPI0036F284C5